MFDTMKLEIVVSEYVGGYRWFVLSDYNNHVIAQGASKSRKTAQKKAEESAWAIKYELFGEAALV